MPEDRDTGWYVYGIVRGPVELPAVPGMDGGPLEFVADDDLSAVVTEVTVERPRGRRRDLISHSDVLNALAKDHDVVPLRFGTVVTDPESIVTEVLAERRPLVADVLARTAGAVQLNLRVSYVEDAVLAGVVRSDPVIRDLHERTRAIPAGTPHPDALRLGRLVSDALTSKRRGDSRLLMEAVLPMVRDSRARDRPDVAHVVDLALLVDRESVAMLETELEAIAEDVHDRMRLELMGPLAPYDFVQEEAWA
jgi:hypothetical protein